MEKVSAGNLHFTHFIRTTISESRQGTGRKPSDFKLFFDILYRLHKALVGFYKVVDRLACMQNGRVILSAYLGAY